MSKKEKYSICGVCGGRSRKTDQWTKDEELIICANCSKSVDKSKIDHIKKVIRKIIAEDSKICICNDCDDTIYASTLHTHTNDGKIICSLCSSKYKKIENEKEREEA